MRLVCDEGVDRQIVARLRGDGHELIYIAELSPRASDDAVIQEAHVRSAVLVTSDRDFGELVYRRRLLSSGVVLLRLAGVAPERKAEIVSAVVREHTSILPGGFTVVSAGQVRRRPLPPTRLSDPDATR